LDQKLPSHPSQRVTTPILIVLQYLPPWEVVA
jgi:hypothetical protein